MKIFELSQRMNESHIKIDLMTDDWLMHSHDMTCFTFYMPSVNHKLQTTTEVRGSCMMKNDLGYIMWTTRVAKILSLPQTKNGRRRRLSRSRIYVRTVLQEIEIYVLLFLRLIVCDDIIWLPLFLLLLPPEGTVISTTKKKKKNASMPASSFKFYDDIFLRMDHSSSISVHVRRTKHFRTHSFACDNDDDDPTHLPFSYDDTYLQGLLFFVA